MRKYFVLEKDSGNRREIDPTTIDHFFRIVEQVTGLDRAIAEPTLRSRPVDHPQYRFTSEPVNPFSPAKVAIP